MNERHPSGKIPDHPFGRIGLCCSGGGYRATSFHLGALSYLNRVQYKEHPLLERVKALSTVSGGTICGVVYALMKQQDKTFEEIYVFLLSKLRKLDLIKLGLVQIRPDHQWSYDPKRQNLINAFAVIYDQEFTHGATFSYFQKDGPSHLQEVMFNATEFDRGLIFRFQNRGILGNRYNNIGRSTAGEIRLADIMAASSCFPGGFEPMWWPTDFIHPEATNLQALQGRRKKSTALMDGGIYDNQGIDSILLSEKRQGAEPYDLIIVCDVTSPYMPPHPLIEAPKEGSWRKWSIADLQDQYLFWHQKIYLIIAVVTLLILLIPLITGYGNNFLTGAAVILAITGLIILWLWYRLDRRIYQGFARLSHYLDQYIPPFYREKLAALRLERFPLGSIEGLLTERVLALSTLLQHVFLKTVRRLVYGRLYESAAHRFRRMSNLIREMTPEDFKLQVNRNRDNPHFYQHLAGCDQRLQGSYSQIFGPRIAAIAKEVAQVETTLWFTEEDHLNDILDKLVAAGQFTMCYNLLVYLTELRCTPDNGYQQLAATEKHAMQLLWDQCMRDWESFKHDPLFLVHQMNDSTE